MKQNNLIAMKCSACSGNTPKLTNEEIATHLRQLIKWQVNDEGNMIFKKFKFNNFKKSLEFLNLVGEIAEFESHHPDSSIGWGYCLVMLHTHAIKGLSLNDFIVASKIDLLSI
tara:strand:- start:343 stop:681 length:339 start_codon:yes stop_codon:yes gene_type:complete